MRRLQRELNVMAFLQLPFRFDPPNSSDYSSSLSTDDISMIACSTPTSDSSLQSSSYKESGSEEVSTKNSLIQNYKPKRVIFATSSVERSITPEPESNCSFCDYLIANGDIDSDEEREENTHTTSTKITRLQNELTEVDEKITSIFADIGSRWNILCLEDEKNLLISFLKKDLILEQWHQPYVKYADHVYIDYVEISNIELFDTLPPTHPYYLCLLIHDTAVLGSEIVCGTTTKVIKFKANFKFTSLRRDFKINVQFYELNIRKTAHKKIISPCVKPIKSFKNCLPNKFELIAETSATLSTVYEGHIGVMLDKKRRPGYGRAFITAEVTGRLNLVPKLFSAFVQFASLTFGRRTLFWASKWCVLDRTQLIIWDSPAAVDRSLPLCIDLLRIVFRQAKRTDCCQRIDRTVVITPIDSSLMFFVCAASVEELRNLLKHINLAIYTAMINEKKISKEEEGVWV